MPAFLTICLLVWQEYLSDCRQASLFICISDWLSPVYSPCMFSYSLLACPASMFHCVFSPQFYVCLPTSPPLCAPPCLFGSVSSHPPRLTPDNATRASNRGLLQSSVKVIETWLTGQAAYSFGGINAAEPQWQLLPTHSQSFAKKAVEDTLDCIRMSVYSIPLERA